MSRVLIIARIVSRVQIPGERVSCEIGLRRTVDDLSLVAIRHKFVPAPISNLHPHPRMAVLRWGGVEKRKFAWPLSGFVGKQHAHTQRCLAVWRTSDNEC